MGACKGITAFVVALIAIYLACLPSHRPLDLEGTLIPLAQKRFGQRKNVADGYPLGGSIVLITGATSGIGLAVTRTLSRLGANVVAMGRSSEKLARLQKEIPSISTFKADFSDLDSVSKAANEIVDSIDHLDILINNAGMADQSNHFLKTSDKMKTAQGFDTVFAVNYLSHFLLTEKVSGLLANASYSTVVQVSSSFHYLSDGSDLRVDKNRSPLASQPGGRPGLDFFRPLRSYANSKLAQILHARFLRRKHPVLSKIPHTRIVAACPAWVGTQIGGSEGSFAHKVLHTMAFPVDGWGIASILLATLSENEDSNNDFFTNLGRLSEETIANLAKVSSRVGLREMFVAALGQFLLLSQNFFAEARTAKSSPESYDNDLAEGLYDWSLKAVEAYL